MKYDYMICPMCKHYSWDYDSNEDRCGIHGVLELTGLGCEDFDKRKKGGRK